MWSVICCFLVVIWFLRIRTDIFLLVMIRFNWCFIFTFYLCFHSVCGLNVFLKFPCCRYLDGLKLFYL